jgi:hypothetical protein
MDSQTQIKRENSRYGFVFGAATVERLCSDETKGWVIVGISSDRDKIEVYVTKTGKMRVYRRLNNNKLQELY